MPYHLVVVKPFARHSRGDVITESAEVERILAGPHANFVVRIPMAGK